MRVSALLAFAALSSSAALILAAEPKPQPRVLPPPAVEIPSADRERLTAECAKLRERIEALRKSAAHNPETSALLPDVEVFVKAVEFALANGEFYAKKPAQDVAAATEQLKIAAERLDALQRGEHPWTAQHGLVVRGYCSALDDSAQPYGLVISEGLELSQPARLYVWLHGRGDTATDLKFIADRMKSPGQFIPPNAIVLHPFGRYCNGFKSAGEVDVLESIQSVMNRYRIDEDRVALAGFSMGGAGAWHLGAHYTDRFAVIHAGAGFADTAKYQNLQPENYPPEYEQTLWRLYDVPNYVRNLFNVPVIAYSGEQDKQIQAARLMEAAYAAENQQLTHLIGPGMGHKYHPEVLKDIQSRIAQALDEGRDRHPGHITFQTRTLRYPGNAWVRAEGIGRHWTDARIEADAPMPGKLNIKSRHVTRMKLTSPWSDTAAFHRPLAIDIDRDHLDVPAGARDELLLERVNNHWRVVDGTQDTALRKRPGQQGPIDDVFLTPFLFVLPSGRAASPEVQEWVEKESQHAIDRWRLLMRGAPRVKRDMDVTEDDLRDYSVVLWGDPQSNALIRRALDKLPLKWDAHNLVVNGQEHNATRHVPALIYPNVLSLDGRGFRYLALNSGLTFREGHDRTNSLQNPKLPDWAVIDVSEAPSNVAPGRIAAAGFFDESWQWSQDR